MTQASTKSQLAFLFVVLILGFSVLFLVPALRPISLLTLLTLFILNPIVTWLEQKKVKRLTALIIIFSAAGITTGLAIALFAKVIINQWQSIATLLPQYTDQAFEKVNAWIQALEHQFGILLPQVDTLNSAKLLDLTQGSQSWIFSNLQNVVGSLFSALFLVPLFSFFVLKDLNKISEGFFKLVPKSLVKNLESLIIKILTSMSEYIHAKFLEAFLVGLMTFIGLKIIGMPYALVFSMLTGLTNIVPYLGPILGAIPPLLLATFTGNDGVSIWAASLVFIIVNAVDTVIIFPFLVGKLVNLSPLVLLVSVVVGQELYGVIGMLIAVPVASILKIILTEVFLLIKEPAV